MNRNYLSRRMFFPLMPSLLLFSIISSFFISRVARYTPSLLLLRKDQPMKKWKLPGSLKIIVFITSEHLLHKKESTLGKCTLLERSKRCEGRRC